MRVAAPKLSDSPRLLLTAVLVSFVLVTLLRLLSSELRIFAYFQEYVYAAALFGFGAGLLKSRFVAGAAGAGRWLFYLSLTVLLLVGAHFTVLSNLGLLKEGTTFFYYPYFMRETFAHELTATGITFGVFWLTLLIFRSLGVRVGTLVGMLPALSVFTMLISGWAIGWLIAGVLIAAGAPPAVLIALVGVLVYLTAGLNRTNIALLLAASIGVVLYDLPVRPTSLAKVADAKPAAHYSAWKPYYHVETFPLRNEGRTLGTAVIGNHNPLQFMFDLNMSENDATFLGKSSEWLTGYSREHYDLIYEAVEKPGRVLVLGAGVGNEVAAALKHGATEVVAIDAEPWLFELGARHPQAPYSSPKVRKIVADPRQYLRDTQGNYDLIVFANVESQTSFSPLGSLRNDGFIYTVDSIVDARARLNKDGFLAISYVPVRSWFGLRLANDVLLAFEKLDAMVRGEFRNIILVGTGDNALLSGMLTQKLEPEMVIDTVKLAESAGEIFPSHDDWPFAFVAGPSIPRTYLYCIVLLLAGMMLCGRWVLMGQVTHGGNREHPSRNGRDALAPGENLLPGREDVRLGMLASALVLVQAKTVMTLAYNFGATWLVAVAAIVGTYLSIAAAASLVRFRWNPPAWLFWILTLAALAAEWQFVNYQAVPFIEQPILRFVASTVVPFIPLSLVAMAVGRSLKTAQDFRLPLGYFFCGAGIGFTLESLSFLFGVSPLNLLALGICVAAIVLSIKKRAAQPEAEQVTA